MINIEEIKNLNIGEVFNDVDLKNCTSFKLNGKAKCLVLPSSVSNLIILLKYLRKNKIKFKIIGKCSNLIFVNNDYDGVLVRLDKLDNLTVDGTKITVGSGYSLMKLSLKLSRMGYTGLEFASGIPGTVGGAIFMNAGAYKSDMGYIVKSVKVLTPRYEIVEMSNALMNFHYRTSFLQSHPDYICLEATLVLKKSNPEEIMQLIEDRRVRRIESQPLEYPSAGSVFRNPPDDYAGRLIEEAGLKGFGIGDALVSQKHANFIINAGNAKGSEIKELILKIKEIVKEKFDIELKSEQEFVE